jgi:hypothetical protein
MDDDRFATIAKHLCDAGSRRAALRATGAAALAALLRAWGGPAVTAKHHRHHMPKCRTATQPARTHVTAARG